MDDSFAKTMGNSSGKRIWATHLPNVCMGNSSGKSMGDSSGKTMDDLQLEVGKYFEQHGISGLEKFLKEKLERCKNVEIKIVITGNAGVGKSSFINAILG